MGFKYNVWSEKSLFQATYKGKQINIACFQREQAITTASGVFHCKEDDPLLRVGYAIKKVYVTERQG